MLPDAPLVTAGPYRYLSHPNYLAVGVELAALPLAFGCYATALIATLANTAALRRRIRIETRALARACPDGASAAPGDV